MGEGVDQIGFVDHCKDFQLYYFLNKKGFEQTRNREKIEGERPLRNLL